MPLHIGSLAPDFTQDSTAGQIHLYGWLGSSWGVLFSHPRDFTPVCTTELGRASALKPEFDRRNVKLLAVSVDSVGDHARWIADIEDTQGVRQAFPILGDPNRQIATLYDMIHPESDSTFAVRSVFIIDPARRIRAIITYPASTGRNFAEILRLIDSLQLTDSHSVATPADWHDGDDVIIVPSLKDPDVLAEKFPRGFKALKPYLRVTPQPNK
jgi:alkyl hydroperoxide reductase subunit AhpC